MFCDILLGMCIILYNYIVHVYVYVQWVNAP